MQRVMFYINYVTVLIDVYRVMLGITSTYGNGVPFTIIEMQDMEVVICYTTSALRLLRLNV